MTAATICAQRATIHVDLARSDQSFSLDGLAGPGHRVTVTGFSREWKIERK